MPQTTEHITRTALITGSGRNIGRAIALALAHSGHSVIINGSSDLDACSAVADEVKAAGANALVLMGDIGVREQAIAIAERGIDTFGQIDVLINNAAIRPSFDLLEDDDAEFERIMQVNFYAAWWLTRACLPGMIARRWGRIINFTGMNAQQGYRGKSAVSISKHAAWGLTKSIAKEYGSSGITANIISPGTIVGEVTEPGVATRYADLQKQNPSGRLGTPDDIAAMVAYLACDQAGFVNGQLLQVNGGVAV